jgi:uncharacterized protein (DUF433 family)
MRGCRKRSRQVIRRLGLKGTRVPAHAIIDNAEDGYTAKQIAKEIFDNLPLVRVRGVLRFAKRASASRDEDSL